MKNKAPVSKIKAQRNTRIAIIGHGFVGKAVDWGFDKDIEKYIVDPNYNNEVKDLKEFNPDVAFICVPTPMGKDGRQNSEIIEKVIKELKQIVPKTSVCIKSTVLPEILDKMQKINEKIVYNPEFLREKHANEDFINAEMQIFGGDRNEAEKISKIFKDNSKCLTKNHKFMDLKSASIVKYSINTFLATKVTFFNEIYQLTQNLNINDSWETIISAISNDKRIGSSHMDVPGHDGRFGFGGACFPKDSLALLKQANDVNQELTVLKSAIVTNNKIRSSYDDLDSREKEQNVSFDFEL